MANLGQLTRDIFRAINELIRLRNRSKLVQGILYAIIDLLIGAKSGTLYFIWRVGDTFFYKIQFKIKTYFILLRLFFFHVITLKAVETFRALPWYEQSCYFLRLRFSHLIVYFAQNFIVFQNFQFQQLFDMN